MWEQDSLAQRDSWPCFLELEDALMPGAATSEDNNVGQASVYQELGEKVKQSGAWSCVT